MYHVRFFKVPVWVPPSKKGPAELHAVLTITNDLGELFFYGKADLVAEVVLMGKPEKVVHSATLKWTPGLRAIPFKVPATVFSTKRPQPYQRAKTEDQFLVRVSVAAAEDLLEEGEAQFLAVESLPVTLKTGAEKIAVRRVPVKPPAGKEALTVYEESQESIARHLWDAGLATASIFFGETENAALIATLKQRLAHFPPRSVLELGAGCGYVGLALSRAYPATREVLLTDLDDAATICERNIAQNSSSGSRVSFRVFDWEDVDDPQKAPLKASTGEDWDLVVVTDCTYNPAYYDALLRTAARVVGPGTVLLVAHKNRNAAEAEFFDRLRDGTPGLRVVLEQQTVGAVRYVVAVGGGGTREENNSRNAS